MPSTQLKRCFLIAASLWLLDTTGAPAQVVETVGSRALGMGGAFVAVASDSSATWWNPAGLAAGPFLDIALARSMTERAEQLPADRHSATWFALATPPFGASFYRLKITDIRPLTPTVTESGSRQDRRVGAAVQSVAASQLGITLVQTLFPGFHAGATLKHMRATIRAAGDDGLLPAGDLLDRGDALEGEETDGTFDADVGLLAVAGPLRAGLLVRNLREPRFRNAAGEARLARQARVGVAYDGAGAGRAPLVVAFDADVRSTETAAGERRNVALGVERWVLDERVGLRAGARFNTVGANERTATAGVSVAVRSGLFVDAHVVRGGVEDERGWGVALRVSF